MKIIKRNGNKVEFDVTKIENAITKAMIETGERINLRTIKAMANDIKTYFKSINKTPSVEEVQDLVEIKLMKKYPNVAKAYILYRDKHKQQREEGWNLSDLGKNI